MTISGSQKPFFLILLFGLCVAGAACFLVLDPFSFFLEEEDEQGLFRGGRVQLVDLAGEAIAGGLAANDPILDDPGSGDGGGGAFPTEALIEPFLTASVRGRVEDAAGDPLAGALIEMESSLSGTMRDILPGGHHRAVAETATSGLFELPLPEEGAFRITVEKKGFAPRMVNPVLPGDDLTVVLETGALLTGALVDGESKEPVAGALVRAHHHLQIFEGTTGEEGTFAIYDLPDGLFSVEIIHEGYDVTRVDGLRVARDGENRVDVELTSAGPLRGRVLTLDGRLPVSGAQVVYQIAVRRSGKREDAVRLETGTDGKGEFLFEGAPKKGYRITVFAEGFSPATPEPIDRGKGTDLPLEIYLKRGSAASGTVFDPDGVPVEGAVVAAAGQRLPGGGASRAVTDGKGRFTIQCLEGGVPVTLFARHDRYSPGDSGSFLVPEGETRGDIAIRLQLSASISGVVYGVEGEPFPGARVTLDGIKGYLVRYGGARPITLTGSGGRFRFEGLVEGEYKLAAAKGSLRSTLHEIFLPGGTGEEAELVLADGLSLIGQVTDFAGDPLDDVLVTAVEWNSDGPARPVSRQKSPKKNSREKQSGKTGKKTGTGRVKGANSAKKKAPPAPPPPSPTARLEGKIKRFISSRPESATPEEYEMMRRFGYARFRGSARSDREGWFTLSGLKPEDVLLLSFRRYGYEPEVLADVAPGAGRVSVVLKPHVSLAGRVVDTNTSAPVRRFRLEWNRLPPGLSATGDLSRIPNLFRGPARNFRSEDGTFFVDNIGAGDLVLRVTAKGYRAGEPKRLFLSDRFPAPFQQFTLERGGVIQGRVVAGNGSSVESMPVFLKKVVKSRSEPAKGKNSKKKGKKTAPRAPSRRTDAGGRFTFSDLDAGSYELIVGNLSSPATGPARVNLGRGKNTSKTIILRDLGEVEIRVKRDRGFSSRALAELSGGPGGVVIRKKAGNLGIVVFSNLLAGRYRLKISAKGYKTWQRKLSLEKGGQIEEDIDLVEKD
jgi:hypothetical protein